MNGARITLRLGSPQTPGKTEKGGIELRKLATGQGFE